jgi:hypothetical protein
VPHETKKIFLGENEILNNMKVIYTCLERPEEVQEEEKKSGSDPKEIEQKSIDNKLKYLK